ncbi:MAG: hypothetical protein VW580_00920 [Flavobacteriaceae bacterium]
MNSNFKSTSALKGLGVSPNTSISTQKGRILELTEQQVNHYLDFNEYRKENRSQYSPRFVEGNFNKIQRIIGEPDGKSKIIFLSVKLKGKNADWIIANVACNSFEMKIKRILWKRKWKFMNTFVGSIEYDKEHLTYHFHSILILKELKLEISETEIERRITNVLNGLEETNEKNAGMVKMRMFPFCVKTKELGDTIEYMVKTSSKQYDPLKRILLNKKEQEQIKKL